MTSDVVGFIRLVVVALAVGLTESQQRLGQLGEVVALRPALGRAGALGGPALPRPVGEHAAHGGHELQVVDGEEAAELGVCAP